MPLYGRSISYHKFKYVGFSLSNLRPKTLDPFNYTPADSEWGQVRLTPSPFGNSLGIYEWVASSAESAEYMSCHSCIYRLKYGPIRKFPGNFRMGGGSFDPLPIREFPRNFRIGIHTKSLNFCLSHLTLSPLGNSLGISGWGSRKKV